jgi:hypothetical protein
MSTESIFNSLCERVLAGHLSLSDALAQLKGSGLGARLELDSFLRLVRETAQKRLNQNAGIAENASVLEELLRTTGILNGPRPTTNDASAPMGQVGDSAPLPSQIQREEISPEILQWARQQFTEEEILAGLHELRETGGLELRDFIHELEEIANRRE